MNKSVMKCCICNNENIGEFVTINDKKYHLCCIEQLQQENQELKRKLNETIHKATEFESEVYELKKQLEDLQETHYLIQGGRGYGKTYLMKLKSELK